VELPGGARLAGQENQWVAFAAGDVVQPRPEHYRDTQSRRLAPLLLQEGPVLPRIRAVMVGYLEIAAQEREPRGCLIANASGERLPRDRAVAALLADVLAVVEDGFLQGLREADRRGELRAGLDLPAHAAMLTMLLEGLQVVAKSEPDPLRLVRAVDATLAGLVGDERAAAGS
jgi:TetR/AcrR family transcriptional repressor of nem operon